MQTNSINLQLDKNANASKPRCQSHYSMSLLKHLTFALMLLLVSVHSYRGIEVTTCNCDKSIFIEFFDTGEPYFCNNPAYNDSTVSILRSNKQNRTTLAKYWIFMQKMSDKKQLWDIFSVATTLLI